MTQHLIEPEHLTLPADWCRAETPRPTASGTPPTGASAGRRNGLVAPVLHRLSPILLLACAATAAPLAAQAQGVPTALADVAADLQLAHESAPMRATAQAFVDRAMAGDRDATLAMLSPGLVARIGPEAAARALDAQILPFFQRGRGLGRSTTVTRTTDAQGARGFAFYQWLEPREGSEARPFTLYVVREQGRLVVANVVPDRLVAGRHR